MLGAKFTTGCQKHVGFGGWRWYGITIPPLERRPEDGEAKKKKSQSFRLPVANGAASCRWSRCPARQRHAVLFADMAIRVHVADHQLWLFRPKQLSVPDAIKSFDTLRLHLAVQMSDQNCYSIAIRLRNPKLIAFFNTNAQISLNYGRRTLTSLLL